MIGSRRRLAVLARSAHLRALALLLGAIGAAAGSAHAEVQNVRIALDWIIQGTHAPFFVAKDRGYFKAKGIAVDTIDAGTGATSTAVKVASGPTSSAGSMCPR